MANVSFFAPTNMANQQTWFGNITGATSTQITITDGFDTGIYTGSFSYSGSNVFGTLTGYRSFAGATLISEISGVSVDANVAANLINNNQIQSLFQLAGAGDDLVTGSSGSDVLFGYGGNDVIKGGGGNDFIDGGTGTNTAVYTGKHTDYSFQQFSGSLVQVTDLRTGSPDGIDQDSNIQSFNFADGTYSFSLGQLISQQTPATIQATNLGVLRVADTTADATAVTASINSGQLSFANYVNQLIAQAQSTTVPAVAVEATMYGATGTSAEVTSLTINFLPAQVANAAHYGLNPQVYACEALGLVFAFGNENGSTAFANNFGSSNSAMPNTTAGDAAFATAASNTIFGSASTANLVSVLQGFVSNWKTFYTANGVPGLSNPSAAQIDLAARGASWGDMVGVALANNLGPLNGQTINFLDDAAQGSAIYGASLVGQPAHQPF